MSRNGPSGNGRLVDQDPEQFLYNLPDALLEIDLATGKYTYASRMAEVLLGYSAEEIVAGISWQQTFAEEFHEPLSARSAELTGDPLNPRPGYQRVGSKDPIEATMLTKRGRRFDAELRASYVLSTNGTPVGIRVLFRDVTARKRAERVAAGSTAILELMIAGKPRATVLREICLMVEGIEPRSHCAVIVVRRDGGATATVVAPSLDIGTAAALSEVDWAARLKTSASGEEVLRSEASLAIPIRGGEGAVLGAVVLSAEGPDTLADLDTTSAEHAARLAGIALQRDRETQSLKKSEQVYRTLAETAIDVMFTLDAAGRFTSINPAGVALTGFPMDEIIGRSVAELLAPENAVLTGETLERVEDGRTDPRPFAVMARTAGGALVPFEVSMQAIPDESGAIGYQGVGRDIRPRLEAEEAVRANELLIDGLLQRSPVSISAWDREGTIKSVLGEPSSLTKDDHIGKNVLTDIHEHDPEGRQRAQRALRGETITSRVEQDGRTLEMTHSPILDADGMPDGVIVTSIDITERARLEGQLRHSQRLESVGRLASGIAHDFNNILAVAMGSASLIGSQVPKDSPIQADVAAIIQATERAAALTQKLLAYGGKQELRPKRLDIGELVAEMGVFMERILRSDIQFSVTRAPALKAVHADRRQLEQVLMNLCVNAQDAMPEGGALSLDVREESVRGSKAAPDGSYIVIRLSDNGIGMSKDTLQRIFEPFFSTKPAHLGTGLGLSTALGIVSQSGGYLDVDSEVDAGTTFAIYLPVADEDIEAAKQDARTFAATRVRTS